MKLEIFSSLSFLFCLVSAEPALAMSVPFYCVENWGARTLQFEALSGSDKILAAWSISTAEAGALKCQKLSFQKEHQYKGDNFRVIFEKSPSGRKIISAKILQEDGQIFRDELVCYPVATRDSNDCLLNQR